ncbi:MAG: LysM peptidoglycan-binding domain-containing protein, partial [Opitutaceae bacterium]
MSLQSIYDQLNAALHQGVIDLAWDTATGLDGALRPIGLGEHDALHLTGGLLTLGADSVLLAGTSTWRNSAWTTSLTGRDQKGSNHFTLVLQGAAGGGPWTFSVSFDNLPQTRRIQENGSLALTPSILNPLVVEVPQVTSVTGTATAAFEGWLNLAGSIIEKYAVYLGNSRLRLSGTFNLSDPAKPDLDLKATEAGLWLCTHIPDNTALDSGLTMSGVSLYLRIEIGTQSPNVAYVTAPLLQGDSVWPLGVEFDPVLTLEDGIRGVLAFFGSDNVGLFSFPESLSVLKEFGIGGVEAGIVPPLGGRSLGMKYASIQLRSKNKEQQQSWNPSIPFVKIREFGTGWVFHWYGSETFVTGNVWGKLRFFEGSRIPVNITVAASIPDFDIEGRTDGDIEIPLADLMKEYLGGSTGLLPTSLTIKQASILASPKYQTYQASLMVDSVWPLKINDVTFNLDRIIAEILVTQAKVTGSVQGFVSVIVPDKGETVTKAVFIAEAAYRGDGIWVFQGGLAEGTLSVLDFAFGLIGWKPTVDLPRIDLTKLWLSYETSEGNPYSAEGALAIRWTPKLLGLTLSLDAEARVAYRKKTNATDHALALASPRRLGAANDPAMIYEGAVSGTFKVNQLAITAGLSFVDKETVYLFEIVFGKFGIRAVTQWVDDKKRSEAGNLSVTTVGEGGGRHQILVISLKDLTLGEIVEYLINLANPNLNYHLEAPWSVLNSINLSRFSLLIDPTEQTITLTYRVDLDLGFMSVKTVGLLYDRSSGNGTVKFVLTGRLLEKEYDSGNELKWDAMNEDPPSIPGQGGQLFELRYLGLGQHITLSKLTQYDSILQVIDELRHEMQPVTDPKVNPLTQSEMIFDPSSQWMFGIDCTVMDTVRLALVMHDSDLYGLVVALSGKDAGSLSGLDFELLYKKVTDNIGVFRVRLQVPDAFRQLQFGYVSITLGIITVDIFTNGNFLVDLGFPHNHDFSVSFGLQAGIFIGSGGLYFGLLDGSTSKRVPAITNGTFSPVLELGIGVAVGVGRTFNAGPLRAGLYVEMVAIFEGVFGWFHPKDAAADTALYYWCRASAGIMGKLYGEIDFKIIHVSVSLEAHAIVTVTFAAYQETLVELDIGVEVHASVRILFIKISFSFELRLTTSFTIGENQQAPWILAPDQSGRSRERLLSNSTPPRRRNPSQVRTLTHRQFLQARRNARMLRGLNDPDNGYDLHWRTDINVFPDGQVHPVGAKMLPAYAIDKVPVQWPQQLLSSEASTQYRLAFLLMVDCGVPPSAKSIKETRSLTTDHLAAAATLADIPFNVMSEAMLRWALAALDLDPVHGTVTAGQLIELSRQLEMSETETQGFSLATLGAFFLKNLEFRISGIPQGDAGDSSGAAFPVPPCLGWDSDSGVPDPLARRFISYQPVDAIYEQEVRDYFKRLSTAPARQATGDQSASRNDASESMATFVFRDYFLLVTKTVVQAATDTMASFPHSLADKETLQGISDLFPAITAGYVKCEGDTVDQVAHFFGYSAAELLALNPTLAKTLEDAAVGSSIAVKLGVTPESIAAANPDWPLKSGLSLALGDVLHQVANGDTLSALAAKFGADYNAWLQSDAVLAQLRLLKAGAAFTVPASAFDNAQRSGRDLIAALIFVRLRGVSDVHLADSQGVPLIEWYSQAIATLNEIDESKPLPAEVKVPRSFDVMSDTLVWKSLPGDTIWSIAAYFALLQNPGSSPEFAAFLEQVRALNPGADPLPRILFPETASTVLEGEMLSLIALRLPLLLPDPEHAGQYLGAPESFRRLVANATILAPLAILSIPGCKVDTKDGQTLSTFAQLYDLSLEEVGLRLATVENLLAAQAGKTLAIPHPASIKISDLVPAVLGNHASTISGQVSRFLLSGLRIPAPELSDGHYHASGPMTGLYELSGQQIPGPAPLPELEPEPAPVRLRITVKNFDPNVSWMRLYDSVALADESSLDGSLLALNRGLSGRNGPFKGLVALAAEADALVFAFTDDDLRANYPDTQLLPQFVRTPQPLPLYKELPVRHGLQQRIFWQTTETLSLPNPLHSTVPLSGAPSLFLFTDNLMAAAVAYPGNTFSLMQVDPQTGPSAQPRAMSRYAWGLTVDIRIRSIPGRPKTYEVYGSDTADRQLLLEAWRYLTDPKCTDLATLHLLYQPASSSGLPNGLASVALDTTATYFIKTNLSTETKSGLPARAGANEPPPSSGEYYARITDSARFATLLWECSVVGGGGYWLHYESSDHAGLPDYLFGSDGSAGLTLLLLLKSQCDTDVPLRRLFSFNNCAVVGESLDSSAVDLFAQVSDDAETMKSADVAPGNVAFGLSLQKPPADASAEDKQAALRELYSQIGYRLVKGSSFIGSTDGMPLGPQVAPKSLLSSAQAPDENIWELRQVVPVHRFAASYGTPDVDGLPRPSDDPYAGVRDATGGTVKMGVSAVQLWFQDILGNASLSSGGGNGTGSVSVPVGYTDPVLGVGAWPSTTNSYQIAKQSPGKTGACLAAKTLLQVSNHLPGQDQLASATVKTTGDQLARFATVYYQLMQDDASVSLSTTLENTVAGSPVSFTSKAYLLSLRDFATATCAWLGTTSRLGDVAADTAACSNLDAAVQYYGCGFDSLALANLAVPLESIFKAPASEPPESAKDFSLPVYAVFTDGATVAGICPKGSDPVRVLADPNNTSLPLKPGVELATPARSFVVPPDPVPPATAPTLQELAALASITVESLARANAATPALLRVGTVFICNGVEIAVDAKYPDVSLNDIAVTLASQGVPFDAAMIAGANSELRMVFRSGVTLMLDRYVSKAGDSLQKNDSRASAEALAPLNTTTANLFAAGTPIYLSSRSGTSFMPLSLGEASGMLSLAPEQILRHNHAVPLATPPEGKARLRIPGHAALPSDATSVSLPYRIADQETLDHAASLFVNAKPALPSAATALASANLNLPDTLTPGKTIVVGGQQITTLEGDSFGAAIARFPQTVKIDAFVASIEDKAGYLKTGALLLCPATRFADPTTAYSPKTVAERYGLSLADFTMANSAVAGLVLPGKQLEITPVDADPVRITTGASDTLNSLVWRFEQAGLVASLADIVAAIADTPFIDGKSSVLLPPPAATLSADLGASGAGWRFPSALFSVHVWLDISRNRDLVNADFRGTEEKPGYAVLARSALPAIALPGSATNRTLQLQQFAADFEAAIPSLRVATGKVLAEERESTPSDIWALAFGDAYIKSVTVEPGVTIPGEEKKIPQYFALRPLDNSLVSRKSVPIQPLKDDGTLGDATLLDFQGIDTETWAKKFIADVDLFLTAPYASPAYATSKRKSLEKVLTAKQTLADGISKGLDYVLELGQPDPAKQKTPPTDWASARESLRQRLLVNLTDGYTTDVVVQYKSKVESPWKARTARLVGPGKLLDEDGGEQSRLSASSAKLSLADTASQTTPDYVNFLVSTSEVGYKRSALLNLSYPVNEVEFNVTEITAGYDASDWLSFVRPLADNLPPCVQFDLGAHDAPLPLRAYPPLPALLSQTAKPSTPKPAYDQYEKALHWDYAFTYQHQSMAPDQFRLEVEFNKPPQLKASNAVDDLFAKLAQYNAVQPALWALLSALPEADPLHLPDPLANAIEVFGDLVKAVADQWDPHWTVARAEAVRGLNASGAPKPERYRYTATLDAAFNALDGKWYYTNLILRNDLSEGDLGWPWLACFVSGGDMHDMGEGTDSERGRVYPFPARIEAFKLLGYEMRFPNLHVATYQNACSQVQVVRNAQLLEQGPPTRAGFVYQTQPLAFPSTLTPLLTWDQRFG